MKGFQEIKDALQAGFTLIYKGGNDFMRLNEGQYQIRSEAEVDPTVWHEVDLGEIEKYDPADWQIVEE